VRDNAKTDCTDGANIAMFDVGDVIYGHVYSSFLKSSSSLPK
jgi:hypothetical protein